jgi:hypothetical protein
MRQAAELHKGSDGICGHLSFNKKMRGDDMNFWTAPHRCPVGNFSHAAPHGIISGTLTAERPKPGTAPTYFSR